jgi:hypothetical protein
MALLEVCELAAVAVFVWMVVVPAELVATTVVLAVEVDVVFVEVLFNAAQISAGSAAKAREKILIRI